MILYVLMVCAFAVATSEFIVVGVLPELASDLDVSLPMAGLLVTAFMVMVCVGGPVATLLTRQLPRRSLLLGIMVVSLVAAVVSAMATSYAVLMAARLATAASQALFMAVGSQVASASVPEERQTAAIARLLNGFTLAAVIGLPVGTLVGQAYGWHASFLLVAGLAAVGLLGVVLFCPPVENTENLSIRDGLVALKRRGVLLGLLTTVLGFTGMITGFTYVAAMLADLAGFTAAGISAALLVYGLGTVLGNFVAGRIPPSTIPRVLPIPLALLGATLLTQGIAMHDQATALLSLLLMGISGSSAAPLLQTWLMREAAPASGLIASINISAFSAAAAIGPVLGGSVIAAGLGLDYVSPTAAIPTFAGVVVFLVIGALQRGARGKHAGPRVPAAQMGEA